jgi:DHA3 family macrolide efflux protein-like MFS transporter
MIALGPFVGALVDRWNRRLVMIVADTSTALFTTLLAALFWLEIAQVWHVFAILFLRSLGDIFQSPAMTASTSLLAPRDQLTRVSGMNETLQGTVNVVSPPLGALLLELLGMQGTLAVDVVTAVLAIAPLLLFAVPQPQKADTRPREQPVLRDVLEAFRFIRAWRGLFFLFIVLALVRPLIITPISFLPLLVTRHFNGGAIQLAWINSANGFGFICGGLILSLWGGFRQRTRTSLLGLVGVAVGAISFGLIPGDAFGLAVVVMFFRTVMIPILKGPIMAVIQSSVPPRMQGRLFTQLFSFVSILAPIGLAIGGPIAEAFGVRVLFILSGAGCLVMALIWFSTPAVLRLEEEPVLID